MKPKQQARRLSVPAAVTFINGKKHVTMHIRDTQLDDWVHKSVILQKLGISDKTLRNLRETRKIPCSKLGGIYYYYLPGILFILEQGTTI